VGSIIIVGGGASGILLAAHLLRRADTRLQITIVEKRGQLGRGIAFSSPRPEHILNVPASTMSAYADAPAHFRDWLTRVHPELPADPFLFAPRHIYGEYLAEVLQRSAASAGEQTRLATVVAEAVGLGVRDKGVEVLLADGTVRFGDAAVLAVGHEEQPSHGRGIAIRADSDDDTPLAPDAPVLILGSGLSMVDAWLSLASRRHRGRIVIVSRHGLLPLAHRQVAPLRIDAADVPFGASMSDFTRWFRELVEAGSRAGQDWRSVVDGLRPHNQRIWQSWTPRARRQFLEHVRPLWNVHRHRLPPLLHARMQEAVAAGQLELVAGKLVSLEKAGEAVRATLRRRGSAATETLEVTRVYDCGGITLDVEASTNPAILSLLAQGLARPDARHIGLDVDTGLHVVDAAGKPSPRLYAVGPLTRGQFFEIEAIPDIRAQVAALAERLLP
jgi:uncharacterized NAD(P)/FAD-binding protein YdhS